MPITRPVGDIFDRVANQTTDLFQKFASKPPFSDGSGDLHMVRHGSTTMNREHSGGVDKIRGWMDVPLSDKGLEESKDSAKALRNKNISHIVSSDLIRARQTAEAISKKTGAPISTTMGLRPWNVGNLTGKPSDKVHHIMEEYARRKPNEPIPGGESFNEFKNRFLDTLKHVITNYPDNVALVTHYRGVKLAQAWIKAGQKGNNVDINDFLKYSNTDKPGCFNTLKRKNGKIINSPGKIC